MLYGVKPQASLCYSARKDTKNAKCHKPDRQLHLETYLEADLWAKELHQTDNTFLHDTDGIRVTSAARIQISSRNS